MAAFSIVTSDSTTTGRTAERPCASENVRAAMVARTTARGCAGPKPVAWLRTRFRWKRPAAAPGTGRSQSGPQPVLSPYTVRPARNSSASWRWLASSRARTCGPSATGAPAAITASASTVSGAGGASVTTLSSGCLASTRRR